MLGMVIFPKYLDRGSRVVDVHIDGVIVLVVTLFGFDKLEY